MSAIPTPAHGGDSRAPAHPSPDHFDGLLLRGGLLALRREGGGDLPPAVESYLQGEAATLPADLGRIPERLRGLLVILRDLGEADRRRARDQQAADDLAELRAAKEARAVLQRIARRAAGGAA